MLAHHPHPFGRQRAIGARQLAACMALALGEHNGFGVFTHRHHFSAKPRLRFIAGCHSAREAAAHQRHEGGDDHAIDQRANHHKSRDLKLMPAQGDIQAAADRPKDDHKGRGRQNCRKQTNRKIRQRFCGHAHIIRNAIFRIGQAVAGNAHPVKALARQPAVQQTRGAPFAPAHLQGLAADQNANPDRRHTKDEHGKSEGRQSRPARVMALQGIEEPSVPSVHGDINEQFADQTGNEAEGEKSSSARRRAAPIATGKPDERPQQMRSFLPIHLKTMLGRRPGHSFHPLAPIYRVEHGL